MIACGYDGKEPVCDPMCGSGTFVIEAAEMAAGLKPGRARTFAFEQLATFDAKAWQAMRRAESLPAAPENRYFGSDRDAGAIRMAKENAARAGVSEFVTFEQCTIGEFRAPEGPPGLLIVNPPYGDRIGDAARLTGLYRTLGQSVAAHFTGWRIGLITTEAALAKVTGLPFGKPFGPVAHGGLRVSIWQTGTLARRA